MKILYADDSQKKLLIIHDDNFHEIIPNPPKDSKHIKLVEEYGGMYEVERTWVDMSREQEELDRKWELFVKHEKTYADSLTIDSILTEEISKADMMKIKMSMFKHEIVKECKNKELLTGLRKAENPIDIIMYFGMIRNG